MNAAITPDRRRRPAEPYRVISMQMSPKHRAMLEGIADTYGLTLSDAVRMLIERHAEEATRATEPAGA